MSDKKKHNSIIFLTTLSVYLGLVLVGGASSPVLAQAALTRNFEIQEEIEFKDELDNKPDETADSVKAFDSYFEESKVLSVDLYRLNRIEKLNLDYGKFEFKAPIFARNFQSNSTLSASKLSHQRAEWLTQKFNQEFKNDKCGVEISASDQLQTFLLNKSENNQVFIVTNLPRASIDSLLAVKDAN